MLIIALLFQWGVTVFQHSPEARWCIYLILALRLFTNNQFHVLIIIMKSVSFRAESWVFKIQFLTSVLDVLGWSDWCDHYHGCLSELSVPFWYMLHSHYAVTACLFHFVLLVKGHQVPFLCFLESFSFCQRSCGSGVFRVEEGDE